MHAYSSSSTSIVDEECAVVVVGVFFMSNVGKTLYMVRRSTVLLVLCNAVKCGEFLSRRERAKLYTHTHHHGKEG